MITKLIVASFKSLENVEVELGAVNVFIGANGSGKSNLLEAVGVLSAAADGKVNDQVLLQRGVRPGLPILYKSAFSSGLPPHIFFGAQNEDASYEVALNNPLDETGKFWRYKTESWKEGETTLASRSPAMANNPTTEFGLAYSKAIEMEPGSPGLKLLNQLRNYVVFSPTTPVLRGIAPETQPRQPVGIHGGRLPEALWELTTLAKSDAHAAKVAEEALELIDWADSFGTVSAEKVPISPAAGSSPRVIQFVDRYMREGRNRLSGYDASEGALYVLFLAVLAAHRDCPEFCAIDNTDHGLNPRLAQSVIFHFCDWVLTSPSPRQLLITAQNPQVLDGLPLQDDRVRLFTLDRDSLGHTVVRRIDLEAALRTRPNEEWTLSRMWTSGLLGGVPNV